MFVVCVLCLLLLFCVSVVSCCIRCCVLCFCVVLMLFVSVVFIVAQSQPHQKTKWRPGAPLETNTKNKTPKFKTPNTNKHAVVVHVAFLCVI